MNPQAMNLGEFRELTGDLPDDWPLIYVLRVGGGFRSYPADASVDLTDRRVDIVADDGLPDEYHPPGSCDACAEPPDTAASSTKRKD